MKNRTLAYVGIGVYILSFFASAENLSGQSTVSPTYVIISGIATITYIFLAAIRLWRRYKVWSILLIASYALQYAFTIFSFVLNASDGSFIILIINLIKVISFLIFVFVIYLLWKGADESKPNTFDTKKTLFIGTDIDWTDIIGLVFRVLEFDKNGTTIDANGDVKAISSTQPYGYLKVESPILQSPIILPIVHKTDFFLAYIAYHNSELQKIRLENDLLVTYKPKLKLPGGFTGITHALHYLITTRTTLEVYYTRHKQNSKQNPEVLFGPFVYEGEVQVSVNLDPSL